MTELKQSKYLTEKELERLLETLERFKDSDFRDTTLIWAILYTGARCSEVLGIRKCDLLEDNLVYVRGIKGGLNREIPIPVRIFLRLKHISRDLNPDDRIFDLHARSVRRIWDQYRPSSKGTHSLRHSFAMGLYRKTLDLRLVQRTMGHRNVNTTQIYTEYHHSREEMRIAFGY